MSCKGSKDCSCGCDKPYGGYERVPLTFGDGGYISKKITNGLDKLIAEQYGGNPKLKEEALAMMKTMAYGGLTEKTSGSVDATADPNAGLSTSAYDAGKTKDGVQFYNKKEGTVLEEAKDAARFGFKTSLGFTTGVVDTIGNMAGADINTSDAVRGMKLGERNEEEIKKRKKAAGISSTVGAATATVVTAAATGNPKLIARGAEQTFTELGEIDPENETLGTISEIGETGADIYGTVAGGGDPNKLESMTPRSGSLPSNIPNVEDVPLAGGGQPAGGIPGLAYGGPVSYRPMNNGGYKNDTDPPKAFTPPNNSQSPDALNVNNVISNSLATPGTSFYPNDPVSFNSNTGRLGDQVADIASSMEANKEDVGRPGIGKFGKIKALLDEEGLCRDNTCVEAVKQFYKKVGEEAMPDNVYDNRTFKQNHKEYGFEEVLDQKDIKKGDIIQYYRLRENEKGELSEEPFHMGVNTSPGKYTGDGAESLPVHISDMYTDTQGNKKDSFRVYRKKMPHGGPHTKVGALQEFLANYDDTLTPRQRGEQVVNTISNTQDDLDRERQRVAKVRANIIPQAEKLAAANARVMEAKDPKAAEALDYLNDLRDPYKYIDSGHWYVPDEEVKKTAADTKALMRKQPQALKNMLPGYGSYNLHAMNPDVYSPGRELYCTPYGCEVYRRAGADDLPIVSGNMSFEKYADEGKIGNKNFPFERVTDGSERQVGDIATKSDLSPNDYGNTTYYTTRPHHTTIYAGDTGDRDSINTYQAVSGNRGQFKLKKETLPTMAAQEELKREKEKKGMPVRGLSEPRFNYFRYVGGVPQYEQELDSREYLLNHLQEQGTFRNPPPPRIDPRSESIPTNVPASDLQGSAYRSLSVPPKPSLKDRVGGGIRGLFDRSSRPEKMPRSRYNLNTAKDMGGPIEYKAGGSYQGGLRRWFKEEWKDVKTGKPCGRSKGEDRAYPYCRPSKKVSSKTPATSSHKDAKKRAAQKTGPGRVKPIKRKRFKK